MKELFRQLLIEAESKHKALGLPSEGWADWYAEYLTRKLPPCTILGGPTGYEDYEDIADYMDVEEHLEFPTCDTCESEVAGE